MFEDLLKHRSGRVIALARVVLAAVFLFAIWIDPRQPVQATTESYVLLSSYVLAAIAVAALTWNAWWLDAKLAMPMHILDVGVFALLVLASDGYTSPFFVFFVFLLLSSAIRWTWRETALTAAAVITIFFVLGLVGSSPAEENFDLQRFIIRSANLVILSGLLIWFGVTHGLSSPAIDDSELGEPQPDEDPLTTTVATAARLSGASSALLFWRGAGSANPRVVALSGAEASETAATAWPIDSGREQDLSAFLFDAGRNRALRRSPGKRFVFSSTDALIDRQIALRSGLDEGLALRIGSDAGEGLLLLGGFRSMCTDHLELAGSLGAALARNIQRHTLFAAVRETAVARTRLSLARDLHDSIVQFLAGATFRVEAISRALPSGATPANELKDLKLLLLQEQQELRSAIGALRSEQIELPTLAADLELLCERLGRQWDINCSFSACSAQGSAPMRLHLDTHQLVREAVANAVRHAAAKEVSVSFSVEGNDLMLEISNDGRGVERLQEDQPWSLRERVDEANGTFMLETRNDGTSVSITLPLDGESRP